MSDRQFSFGRLAVASLGAATLVLVATTTVIAWWRPGPGFGLLVVVVGIVAAIAAMGVVSTSMTRRTFGESAHDTPHPQPPPDLPPPDLPPRDLPSGPP
ncbi:MAG: hypothetical protein WBQ44_03210 [Rhodococcus sp. (in: high G+C Gram-positive bacteria)]